MPLATNSAKPSACKMLTTKLDNIFQSFFGYQVYMGQVTELWLSCYLALLPNYSKTRQQDSRTSVTRPKLKTHFCWFDIIIQIG